VAQDHGVRQYTALSASFTSPVSGSGPPTLPVVLLHGFTQTGASWAPIVAELKGRSPIILPDAPGHGGSSQVRADLWRTADLLVGTVGGPALWVGYSMGGRTALHVALAHPDQVAGLVLISATAGIDAPDERAARRAADDELAARIQRDGTEAFLDSWLAQPLFRSLPPVSAGRKERLANTPDGLASSLRLAGTGSQGPLWARLGELRERSLPVLLIAGELDTKYRDQAVRMASAIGPCAGVLIVGGAGHACHLEQPRIVSAAISAMAGQIGPASSRPAAGSDGEANSEQKPEG
jgi:2-succinyl-6-hydroxy-2,4-cyclohexadiene-1-carboxylate synthase